MSLPGEKPIMTTESLETRTEDGDFKFIFKTLGRKLSAEEAQFLSLEYRGEHVDRILGQALEARNTLPLEAMSFIDRTLTFGYYPLAGQLCPREPLLGSSVLWSIADPRAGSSTVHPFQSGALPECDA
jgi:hypothetical protein